MNRTLLLPRIRGMARSSLTALTGIIALSTALFPAATARAGITVSELQQVGYDIGGMAYYASPYCANALWLEDRGWRVKKQKPGGQSWEFVYSAPLADQQDAFSNPLYMQADQISFYTQPGQNSNDKAMFVGRVVLTWSGSADIRVSSATFLPNGHASIPAGEPQSNGPATGMINNGVRVYQTGTNPNGCTVEVFAMSTTAGQTPTNIKLWLPDPDTGNSLINQTWQPRLLARLAEAPWAFIRFMDMTATNANPQQDWADRRRPQDTFQKGVINPRSPAPGAVWYIDASGNPVYFTGNRHTGLAWEHCVGLANAANKHMWINVPHMATDAYITNLARLIRYGSDANGNPYTSDQASPVYPPLNSSLKVFIEFSNEIWSNGNSFPQGNWASLQASQQVPAISKAQWNARRFSDTWKIFEQTFGGAGRLVKVGAIWTGQETYTTDFLKTLKSYGATLTPAQEPDVISPTTYFGNGIQDWAHQKAITMAGSADEWFYTTGTFGTPPKNISKPLTDPYWTGTAFARHMNEAFLEWKRRMLSGAAVQGGGFDATGVGGGFSYWLVSMSGTTFATAKPIVAYEGGPSLYTDYLDGGDVRDDGITNFVVRLNRIAPIQEVYRTHLNMAKAKGLVTHAMFTDLGAGSKFGQWGHIDGGNSVSSTDPVLALKYQFIKNWFTEAGTLRSVNQPLGAVPAFDIPAELPQAFAGTGYSRTITASGGNGTRVVEIIDQYLSPGLATSVAAGVITVSGTPSAVGSSYIYARVKDADGDPAWRTFTIRTVQRSSDPETVVTFEGLPNTSGTKTAEPLDVSGFRFTSIGNSAGNALQILGTAQAYASNVLNAKFWGTGIRIQRANAATFDLTALDIAQLSGSSAKLVGYAPGGITMQKIVTLPVSKTMTHVDLDWITLEKVEITWHDLADGSGGGKFGAIDNVDFNGNVAVPAAWDSMEYPSGSLLHGLNGGTGWSNGWQVESGTSATGYNVATGSLAVTGLGNIGNSISGGSSWTTCGRTLNVAGALAPWRVGTTASIGADNTELWMSYVIQLGGTSATSYQGKVSLDESGAVYHDNAGIVRVKNVAGKWRLSLLGDTVIQATTIPVTTNPTLIVLRLQFGVTDTVSLWVNPDPAVAQSSLGTPAAQLTTTSGSFKFQDVTWNPGPNANAGKLDEIRFGDSYEAVTPAN